MTGRVRTAAVLAAVLAALPVAAARGHAKPYCERLYESARRDYYALIESDRRQKFRDSWDGVIKKFTQIAESYPDCEKAPDALFNVGVLYRKLYRVTWVKDDLTRAQETFGDLAKRYPKSTLADDALLNRADVLVEMGDKRAAYAVYSDLAKRYPKGDKADEAQKALGDLASFAPRLEPEAKPAAPAQRVAVTEVKHWSNPDYTRVVVRTTGSVTWTKNQLPRDAASGKPPRLYLDIRRAFVPASLCDPIPIADGLLLQARINQHDTDTVRLVLDIDSISDHRVFAMENPSRLVIDLVGEGKRIAAASGPPAAKATAKAAGPPQAAEGGGDPLPLHQQFGLGVKRIVIDPGHGGKDPGAIGKNGLKEKDVTLALALRARPILVSQGYEVLLTRDTDVFVELDERTAFANKAKADLFVSVHTNASRSRAARGVETYFLGVAKDREASETAQLENAINERTMADLDVILLDLMRAANSSQSSLLAESIQDRLYNGLAGRYPDVKNHGVKQAGFYVLIGAEMPAVLVETSFISHPQEEKLLTTHDYRDALTDSITTGILDFVKRIAPGLDAGTGASS